MVRQMALEFATPPPASPLRPSRGNGGSPPKSRANSCKYLRRRAGRYLTTSVRLVSPRRLIEPELFDILIQVFVQRIDQRSRQFGLLLRTKLVELFSEFRNISGHLRYSQGQSEGFQFTPRDCVTANACVQRRAAKRSVRCNAGVRWLTFTLPTIVRLSVHCGAAPRATNRIESAG